MTASHPQQPLRRAADSLLLLVLLALVFTPLVVDYAAYDDAYFAPKWAWIAVWSALGLAATFARMLAGRPAWLPLNALWLVVLGAVAFHWLRCLGVRSGSLAVERAAHVTWLAVAVGVGLQWSGRPLRQLRAMGRLAVGVATLTALWVLFEDGVRAWSPGSLWYTANLPDWRGYLAAGLGNTNHLGDLLAVGLLVTLVLLGESRRPKGIGLYSCAALIQTAALIVCYSVGSNLGLILGALVMAGLTVRRTRGRWFARRPRRWIAIGVAWALIVAFYVTDHPANPHRPGILRTGFGSERWHEGGPTRLAIWTGTLEMIQRARWLGVGTGNFTYVFPEMPFDLTSNPALLHYQGLYTNAAHNEALQAWAELGIGGLLFALVMVVLAYDSLLRGLEEARGARLMVRIALAGVLTAWLAQAQMNFIFQHPAGGLTLAAILLGIILEREGRRGRGNSMPPLLYEVGPLVLSVRWLSMRRPIALGLAFAVPPRVGMAIAAAGVLVALACVPHFVAPVRAQRHYMLAKRHQLTGAAPSVESHYVMALDIDPEASDIRSAYSAWLINERHRPEAGLAQLEIVRRRLNSPELYEREARAWRQLGEDEKAEAAMQELYRRAWVAREASGRNAP